MVYTKIRKYNHFMDFSEVIAKRHSVRKYTDAKKVGREMLDKLIGIAATAPSSKNCKSSAFMLIDDSDTLAAISEMRTRGSSFVKDAPAAIVVMGDSSVSDLWEVNSAISATFIQLAATDLGLGSCWVHVSGRMRDPENSDKGTAEEYIKNLLGLKDNYRVLCIIAVGYEDRQQS